jgi:glycosyltransferase involved in cell wall biosynthesis
MHNVIFLSDWAPRHWGTREEIYFQLCRALKARGSQAVLTFSEDLPPDVAARMEQSGAKVATLQYSDGYGRYYRQLGELIERYSITTAHVRFFDYFSAVPWLARLHGVREILFTEANSGEWHAAAWKKSLIRLRTSLMCHPLTRVIAISGFIRDRLIAVGIPAEKIDIVTNGVDTDRFKPDPHAREIVLSRLGAGPGDVLVTTASTLLGWKHTDVLVRACASLRSRGIPVRLLVAGAGPLLASLQELAGSLGIADRVHWLGNRAEVHVYLQACDIFALASVGEAFGNVLAEAMACSVPVVGTRSGAIPEVIEDGRTGLLAAPGDPSSFAAALERLALDPALRGEMGVRGRERACALFGVDEAVRGTLRVYDSIWGRAAAAS